MDVPEDRNCATGVAGRSQPSLNYNVKPGNDRLVVITQRLRKVLNRHQLGCVLECGPIHTVNPDGWILRDLS
jgi:hypothetical protein